MLKAEELMIGSNVLVDGKSRYVEAITKKKIGYHYGPGESRMYYARLCEVQPRPLNYDLARSFNDSVAGKAFLWWDDRCTDCSHQYKLCINAMDIDVRYVHEVQRIARVFGFKNWFSER